MKTLESKPARADRCPACGTENRCALAQSSTGNDKKGDASDCWCMTELKLQSTPAESEISDALSCYCLSCLLELRKNNKELDVSHSGKSGAGECAK